jgi:hypothetical protein
MPDSHPAPDGAFAMASCAGWLSGIQTDVAAAAAGHGLAIAVGAASLSAAIGSAVLLARCPKTALALSAAIALVYLVIGQGIGGIFTGSGTDPGTGPLIILLAISIYPLHRDGRPLTWRLRRISKRSQIPGRSTPVVGAARTVTGSEQTSA